MRHLLVLLALALLPASAQVNQLTPEEKAAGWKLLFDGRTLEHFRDSRTLMPAGDSWAVEEGAIKAVRRPRIREDLVTKEAFRDFEFAWEWKVAPKGNSGVKYRIQDFVLIVDSKRPRGVRFEQQVHQATVDRIARKDIQPADRSEEYVVGFEYQMIDDKGHPDAKNGDTHTSGALYDMIAPTKLAARPAGEWNQSRLVVRGDRIEHYLNGELVVNGTLADPAIAARITKRWSVAPIVEKALLSRSRPQTPISLQNHNDEAWFRNLKVRRLP